MPVPPDLFVGLVTHPRTRFPECSSERGLGPVVVRTLREAGLTVEWQVSGEDEWTPELLPINGEAVSAAISAEFEVEGRWRSYVSGAPLSLMDRLLLTARRLKRRVEQGPRGHRHLSDDDAGFRSVRRLANIELSHMRLLRNATASKAEWALILEDDAGAPDPEAFARNLHDFLIDRAHHSQPRMLSLSESFTPTQLGIGHLITPIHEDIPGAPWTLWASERPVTNTVCATLYRGDFLANMVQHLERIPLSPIIPIDFKVNEALMQMATSTARGACWLAHPAPLLQRSGVPKVHR